MHVWRLLRTRLETSNQRNIIDRAFSCLPTGVVITGGLEMGAAGEVFLVDCTFCQSWSR